MTAERAVTPLTRERIVELIARAATIDQASRAAMRRAEERLQAAEAALQRSRFLRRTLDHEAQRPAAQPGVAEPPKRSLAGDAPSWLQ
jgi:hypothetical protein